MSASRGFFDCGHFKQCNEWLALRYGEDGIIDWNLNPAAAPKRKVEEDVPPAVVAVGKVDEKGEEESKVLEEEGEEGTAKDDKSD